MKGIVRITKTEDAYALLFKHLGDFEAWRDKTLFRVSDDPRFIKVPLRKDALGQIYEVDDFLVWEYSTTVLPALGGAPIRTVRKECAVKYLHTPGQVMVMDVNTGVPAAQYYTVWVLYSDFCERV